MSAARKLGSALRLLRSRGPADALALAQLRAAEGWLAHRPLPSNSDRRARLLAETLNRWGGLSAVPVARGDLAGARGVLLRPYLRQRFAAAAATAADLGTLRPVEAAMAADSALAAWDFAGIAAALPAWTVAAAGTPFARRVDQVGRRAALRLGRLSEAARDIHALGDDRGALVLRGDLLDALGHLDEAGAAYAAAVERDGADPYARQARGFNLMKAGRVREGLASWGASDALAGAYPLRRHRPQWAGEPLGRRRLMVLFEHGLGDMIQAARFLPRLLAREPEAEILARLPAPLLGLFARQFPRVRFVPEDEREPPYDLFVPSMQLACALDAPSLEPRTRYIDLSGASWANPRNPAQPCGETKQDRVGEPTQSCLGAPAPRRGGRPRVGVCWRGHPRQYEFTRSVPLDLFASLFAVREVEFAVLLNRLTPEENRRIAAEPGVVAPPIRDFLDLAALTASCDLVVSVDTAVVHLAGAGGVPTLLLSRPDSCWRWGAAGPEGPWYADVEVLRHDGDMDWPRLLRLATERVRAHCLAPAAA